MKAKYQIPEIEMLTAAPEQMIAESLGNGENPRSQNLYDAPTTTATEGNLSRRSIWNDEDDF